MKKLLIFLHSTILLITVINQSVDAQSLEERLEKFGSGFAKGYVQPFVNAFGANLNSGIFHTADVSTGIDVYVGAKFMFALIPSSAQEFDADLSGLNALRPIGTGLYPTPVKTVTIFGDKGTQVISTGGIISDTLPLPNGINLKAVLLAIPHISVGNIFGTRAMFRFFPTTKLGDFGEFSFLGLGLQHDISQYLIGLPFDWSAHIMYQNLKVKPVIEGTAYSLGTEISKTFLFATIYGGVAYEYSNLSIKYNWQPPIPGAGSRKINFDLTGQNSYRATVGLSLKLLILHINAEYNLAKQPTAVLGLGIAI